MGAIGQTLGLLVMALCVVGLHAVQEDRQSYIYVQAGKPGTCPNPRPYQWGAKCPPYDYQKLCSNDTDCPGAEKCCAAWEVIRCPVCMAPRQPNPSAQPNTTKAGQCPPPSLKWPGDHCARCSDDSDCAGPQKCCKTSVLYPGCTSCQDPSTNRSVTETTAVPNLPVLSTVRPATKPSTKPNGTKPGRCPYPQFRWGETCPPPFGGKLCSNDSQCPGAQKCCSAWRIMITDCYVCMDPLPPVQATFKPLPTETVAKPNNMTVVPSLPVLATKPATKPNGTKPGRCPGPQFRWGETCPPPFGGKLCSNDSQCPGAQKCCNAWRIMITDCYVCMDPLPPVRATFKPLPTETVAKPNTPHEGLCPPVDDSVQPLCVDPPPCQVDQDCKAFEKCCFTGCSSMCVDTTPEPPRHLQDSGCTYYNDEHYENGQIFSPDDDDCTLCQCFNGESMCHNTCRDIGHEWIVSGIAAGGALLISLIFTLSTCCCLKCCCKDQPQQTIVMQAPPVMQAPTPGNLYFVAPSKEEKVPLTGVA